MTHTKNLGLVTIEVNEKDEQMIKVNGRDFNNKRMQRTVWLRIPHPDTICEIAFKELGFACVISYTQWIDGKMITSKLS